MGGDLPSGNTFFKVVNELRSDLDVVDLRTIGLAQHGWLATTQTAI
jgi:hypothetical protein